MHIYLSTDPEGDVFGHKEPLPYFVWNDITFGDWNEARVIDLDVNFSQVCPHTVGYISAYDETRPLSERATQRIDVGGHFFGQGQRHAESTLQELQSPSGTPRSSTYAIHTHDLNPF